jgi:hypothetical protein
MSTKFWPFEFGRDRYRPDPGRSRVIDSQILAALVGAIAILLPIILYLGTKLGVCFYDTVSHFYYASFLGGVFVGAVVFIGTFFMAYTGECPGEGTLARFAGAFAYGVALLPTSGAGCTMKNFAGRMFADLKIAESTGAIEVIKPENSDRFFELFKYVGVLHYASAGLLFLLLAYFCFFVFTRIVQERHIRADGKTLTWHKWIRNAIYRICGTVILLCMVALICNSLHTYLTGEEWAWWVQYKSTLWLETFIIWAFGISWITKGRFFRTLLRDDLGHKPY